MPESFSSIGQNPNQTDNTIEVVSVPREMVGIIIGRGGETIRKIGSQFDVRLQFNPDDGVSADRVCAITKLQPSSDIQGAAQDVRDRVDVAKQQELTGRRGPPRENNERPRDFKQESTMAVPADKCGIVIGKAGCTINEIKSKSGAYVELQRNIQPPDGQKLFSINGTAEQIQIAMDLIREKAGMHGGGGGGDQGQMQHNMNSPFPPHLTNQGPNGPGFGQGWGDMNFQQQRRNPSPKDNTIQYPNFYQQQSGMNQFNQPQQQQQQQQQPQFQQAQQQPQLQLQPNLVQQQQQAQPQQQQQIRPQTASQPMINRETGQPDYSLQWYEYYMNIAMYNEANMILQQAPHVASALQAKQQQQQQQPQIQQQQQQQQQQQPHWQ